MAWLLRVSRNRSERRMARKVLVGSGVARVDNWMTNQMVARIV